MKTLLRRILCVALVTFVSVSCSKDSDSSDQPNVVAPINLGTFAGNFQVTDDPQTDLGYIYNTDVTLTSSGSVATIKIKGDGGFDREFTGSVLAGSTPAATLINLSQQTKPSTKNVSGKAAISGNELGLDINIASDAVQVKDKVTDAAFFKIEGKLVIIGTNLIKK
jgi:hypothetical protein